MREILFRGKRLDNGEWVYGSFMPDMIDLSGKDEMCDWGFIKQFGKAKEERQMQYVEKETAGQYMGLTDKNGVKIFEGDIVTGYFSHEEIVGYILYGSSAEFFIQRDGLYGIGLNNASENIQV